MIIEASNFLAIIIIMLVLGASSLALYFPLLLLWRKGGHILALTIPLSLSVEILLGYVFYTAEWTQHFPLWYGMVVILLNGYALVRLKQLRVPMLPVLQLKHWRRYAVGVGAALAALLYTRFYDAFMYIAPGNNDTYNHIYFLNDFERIGYLSSPFYAPGFHLLLYPLKLLMSDAVLYRFTGPVLGLIVILALYLIMRQQWQRGATRLAWLLLMTSPVYNQLILQTISFFPSALTFIFLVAFLYLIVTPAGVSRRALLGAYTIISVALALTVPYLFVQYIPMLVVFTVVISIWRKRFAGGYARYLIHLCLISIFALGVGVGHVFLQTRIVRHTIDAFPEIPIVETTDNQITIRSNYKTADDYTLIEPVINSNRNTNKAPAVSPDTTQSGTETWWQVLKRNSFIANNVLPIISVAQEVLRVKNVRPFYSVLGVGSYLWVIIAAGMLAYGVKRRLPWLSVVAVCSLVFGLATQTGILELSYYRGRSGWYLMLLSQLGVISLFDIWYRERWRWLVYGGLALLFLSSFISPPVFYRPYYTEPFTVAKQIQLAYPDQTVHFITNIWPIVMVSADFTTAPLAVGSVQNAPATAERFLVLEKTFFSVNPVLSQQAYSTDANFQEFQSRQQALQDQATAVTTEIKSLPEFSDYTLYWENATVAIYRYQPSL